MSDCALPAKFVEAVARMLAAKLLREIKAERKLQPDPGEAVEEQGGIPQS